MRPEEPAAHSLESDVCRVNGRGGALGKSAGHSETQMSLHLHFHIRPGGNMMWLKKLDVFR